MYSYYILFYSYILKYLNAPCLALCVTSYVNAVQYYLKVGNPQIPMAMSIARNISTSFKVSYILVHSCALALGCCSKCSFSLSRYCCAYRLVSVWISCRIWLLKNSRKKSTGDFSSIPAMTPGLAVNLGGCSTFFHYNYHSYIYIYIYINNFATLNIACQCGMGRACNWSR